MISSLTNSPFRRAARYGRFVALAALLLLSTACLATTKAATEEKPAPLEANTAERTPDTLAIEVADFTWVYLTDDGAFLRINGTAINNTGQPIQAVTLFAAIYDEKGQPLGQAKSFLTPSYLVAGGEGAFEYTIMSASRRKDLKFLKLVTQARTLN